MRCIFRGEMIIERDEFEITLVLTRGFGLWLVISGLLRWAGWLNVRSRLAQCRAPVDGFTCVPPVLTRYRQHHCAVWPSSYRSLLPWLGSYYLEFDAILFDAPLLCSTTSRGSATWSMPDESMLLMCRNEVSVAKWPGMSWNGRSNQLLLNKVFCREMSPNGLEFKREVDVATASTCLTKVTQQRRERFPFSVRDSSFFLLSHSTFMAFTH